MACPQATLNTANSPLKRHHVRKRRGHGSSSMQRPNLSAACQKTKLCSFFLQGFCPKGEACCFAHGEHELKSSPDLQCTKLCPYMTSSGGCSRGASCKFAHDESELRSLSPVNSSSASVTSGTMNVGQVATYLAGIACVALPAEEGCSGFSPALEEVAPKPKVSIGLYHDSPDSDGESQQSTMGGNSSDSALSAGWRTPTGSEVSEESWSFSLGHLSEACELLKTEDESTQEYLEVCVHNTFLDVRRVSDDLKIRRSRSAPPQSR